MRERQRGKEGERETKNKRREDRAVETEGGRGERGWRENK